jgi:hypothetical protein
MLTAAQRDLAIEAIENQRRDLASGLRRARSLLRPDHPAIGTLTKRINGLIEAQSAIRQLPIAA